MAFGEAYQGMSDREIMIEIATKQDVLAQQVAGIAIRQEKLEQKVDAIRCPSPRCQDHSHRIGVLEKADQERAEAWGPRTAYAIVVLTVVSVIISVIALLGAV